MAFITVAGENQIAAKQGAGQLLNITHFVLAYISGLGSEPVNRIEAMPAGGNIMATLPVTQHGYVNTNQVVYSLVMDSSLGDYDFNWVGLKDADGVLIAVAYSPLIQKRKTIGAIPGNNLTRNFLIAFSGIQATTAISVPAETWQIDFNARLLGIDERERLSNYDIYGHEAFIGTGWKVVRQGATTSYDVLPGIGYVGGVRIADATTQVITVSGPPKSVWLDVSLQGDISDVSAVVAFIIDAVAHTDYTDANGFKHYVTKIASIAGDGSVTDLRYVPIHGKVKFTANGSFTPMTNKIIISAVAGGGGGGGSGSSDILSAASSAGSGGGAGESIIEQEFTVTPFVPIPITIGAGGLGGNAANIGSDNATNGTSGGDTIIGSLITLNGGGGGGKGGKAIASTISGPAGGNGYPAGGTSPDGGITGGFIYSGVSGIGGSSPFGGGGCPSRASSGASLNGLNGHGYGSGASGGGAVYNNSSLSGAFGGNGAQGAVWITF